MTTPQLIPSARFSEDNMKHVKINLILLCVFSLLISGMNNVFGETASELFDEGTSAYSQGNYQKAIFAFEKAIERKPEFSDAYYYLGLIYSQMSKPHKAITAFKQVVTLDADPPENHYNLGALYHGIWVLDKAVKYYHNTIDRDSGSRFVNVRFLLAQAYFQLGKYEDAEKYYHHYLKLDPTDLQQVEEANNHLKLIAHRRKNPYPSPPARIPLDTSSSKTRGKPTFLADFYQTRLSSKLQPTDDIPFSPDVYGRYQRKTNYLVNFRPYKINNVFLMWKAVVEHVRYQRDITAHRLQEAWQYPDYTYRFRQGDCEDSSLLLCDWLRAMGYDAKVVTGHNRDGAHAWVALIDENGVYYLETALTVQKISRRHLPKLNASIRQYQVKDLFDGDKYWQKDNQ